mmetsp:Transcript_64592/g.88731  ORF Transcript_64592/g.88731 Transcript_64592/m.88731 type:complete len:185 (-) Transcript_64592:356-910(-)
MVPCVTLFTMHRGDSSDPPLVVYPLVYDASEESTIHSANRTKRVLVPDTDPALAPADVRTRLSFTHGDFVSTFRLSAYASLFDAVVTCFFLDTAANIVDYLSTIESVLKPCGVWINHGPLQWHVDTGFHLALDEVIDMLSDFGLRLLLKERLTWSYYSPHSTHQTSLRPQIYQPAFLVAQKQCI